MSLDYSGIVAAVTLGIYGVEILIVPFFLARPSFGLYNAWFFLITFCALRIVGSSLQISLETSDSFNKHLFIGADICNAIGLGPLFLITTSLLRQCNAFLHTDVNPNQTHRALVTFDLVTVVATAVGIAGGVTSFKGAASGSQWNPTAVFQAGVCLYLASYVCTVGSAAIIAIRTTTCRGSTLHETDRLKLIVASVLIILSLLAVRVIYSMLLAFDESKSLSPFNGSETIRLFMQSLMEWLITFFLVGIGLATRNTRPPVPRQEKDSRDERGTGRQMLRFVPFVHWFVR